MTNPFGPTDPHYDAWERTQTMPATEQVSDSPHPGSHGPVDHRGQMRMAERFVRQSSRKLRYAHGLGWLVWDGTRWSRDRDGAATRCAVETLRQSLVAAVELDDKRAREELFADVRRCESAAGLAGMLTIASNLRPMAVAAELLDPDPHLFNTTTGTLDLRTGELRAHDPSDLITKIAGTGYDRSDDTALFDKFVGEVLPDQHIRSFAARLFGYSMLGEVRDHVLPIFCGVGQNGKSTLLGVVAEAFGEYAIAADPDLLVDRGLAHPTGQADLLGVRLAVTTETDHGRRLAAATVKRLTGGDVIRARRMRQDFFEFSPSHTIVMVTNHRPVVAGDDAALWRRLCVVPFDVVIDNPDPMLPERLRLHLGAVLAWTYAGWCDYRAAGLRPPAAVRARTEEYRRASDAIGRFLDERTYPTDAGRIQARHLYSAWLRWCNATGEDPGSEKDFAERMGLRGHTKTKTDGRMTYRGMVLLTDETSDDDE